MLITVKNNCKSQVKKIFFFTFFFTNIVVGFSIKKKEAIFLISI